MSVRCGLSNRHSASPSSPCKEKWLQHLRVAVSGLPTVQWGFLNGHVGKTFLDSTRPENMGAGLKLSSCTLPSWGRQEWPPCRLTGERAVWLLRVGKPGTPAPLFHLSPGQENSSTGIWSSRRCCRMWVGCVCEVEAGTL